MSFQEFIVPSHFQLHALHGFLGSPYDWSLILGRRSGLHCHPLHAAHLPSPKEGFHAWAQAFNQSIRQQQHPSPVLIGYSLGGRLALHALIDDPSLWKAAVIISSHPGLPEHDNELRERRWQSDQQWAARFRADPWHELMQSWNSQPPFGRRDFRFCRREEEFNREILSEVLDGWSLAKQADLRSFIQQLTIPIFWMAGELDITFARVAQTLTFKNEQSRIWVAKNARHRLPWQLKKEFKEHLMTFLRDLEGEEQTHDRNSNSDQVAIHQEL